MLCEYPDKNIKDEQSWHLSTESQEWHKLGGHAGKGLGFDPLGLIQIHSTIPMTLSQRKAREPTQLGCLPRAL